MWEFSDNCSNFCSLQAPGARSPGVYPPGARLYNTISAAIILYPELQDHAHAAPERDDCGPQPQPRGTRPLPLQGEAPGGWRPIWWGLGWWCLGGWCLGWRCLDLRRMRSWRITSWIIISWIMSFEMTESNMMIFGRWWCLVWYYNDVLDDLDDA